MYFFILKYGILLDRFQPIDTDFNALPYDLLVRWHQVVVVMEGKSCDLSLEGRP